MEQYIVRLQQQMKVELSEKRFSHTLGVQYTCACLAMRYQVDIKKATISGLLHDCAKSLTNDKMLSYCIQNKILITDIEKRNPYLLHAKVGAHYAKYLYYISDKEILNAISCHTTGKANMNKLEMILYIADYIEPSRKEIQGLAQIRELAFVNLNVTIYKILENTLLHLKQTKNKEKKEIDLKTVEAYEFYKKIVGDQEE
jgi:predicted HD superfamily hydrolase involved in NAD metabolism